MQLTDERIEKFQMLYKKHFGKEISKEQALEKGMALSRLIQLIWEPMTPQEYQEYVIGPQTEK